MSSSSIVVVVVVVVVVVAAAAAAAAAVLLLLLLLQYRQLVTYSDMLVIKNSNDFYLNHYNFKFTLCRTCYPCIIIVSANNDI